MAISPDRFAEALEKILKDYHEDVNKDINQLAKKFGQKGAKEVKSASGQFGGRYAGGCTSKYEEGRLSSMATIYNGKVPGLPHLLENGHAKRNGGRVAGRSHIAPVEKTLIDEFTKAVESAI